MIAEALSQAHAYGAFAIGLGLCLDAMLGDPRSRWHPVRLLGAVSMRMETLSRRVFASGAARCSTGAPRNKRLILAGAVCWLTITALAAGSALALSALAGRLHPLGGLAVDALIVWASIAPRDLIAHALRVRKALARDAAAGRAAPEEGRGAVAMIVGRKVDSLDYAGVCRACIESVAESSIDGVAAPLFWAALLGPAGAFAYRAINTMDSLFGHKDARYFSFGLVAARADDYANCLPARLSSLIACIAAPLAQGSARGALRSFLRYRLAHESPNAGHPEAVYAGVMGLRLGGPALYAEGLADKPWMNPMGRDAAPEDIGRSLTLLAAQTLFSAALFMWLSYALRLFCY